MAYHYNTARHGYPEMGTRHDDPHGIVVVRAHLGQNVRGGQDFWLTFRGSGDNLSPDQVLIGVVQNKIVTGGGLGATIGGNDLQVVRHLQASLNAAFAAFEETYKGWRACEEGYDASSGPLGDLPNGLYGSMDYNTVIYEKVHGDKIFYNRTFIRWSKRGLQEVVDAAPLEPPATDAA